LTFQGLLIRKEGCFRLEEVKLLTVYEAIMLMVTFGLFVVGLIGIVVGIVKKRKK